MNFDTRTVIDLMKLNEKLKDDIIFILEEESLFIKKVGKNAKVDEFMFISDTVLETIIPIIKDCLKYFLKKDLFCISSKLSPKYDTPFGVVNETLIIYIICLKV